MKTALSILTAIGIAASAVFCLEGSVRAEEIFAGAGDIALCNGQNDELTADLLDTIPGTVFTLGDNAYQKGTQQQFGTCYEQSWGRHKARTRPAIGNHEYMTNSGQPYLDYFGFPKNYSYDLGDWHVVSLDSNCNRPENGSSCKLNSAAMQWLKADLTLNSKPCTLVYFHHPRWSSELSHGSTTRMSAAWKIMYDARVDIVLSSHAHVYERFKPLNPNGQIDMLRGIRSFVVGTGGSQLSTFGTVLPGSEVRNALAHGVLKLTLRASDYSWQFIPVAGKTFSDEGADICR